MGFKGIIVVCFLVTTVPAGAAEATTLASLFAEHGDRKSVV